MYKLIFGSKSLPERKWLPERRCTHCSCKTTKCCVCSGAKPKGSGGYTILKG